MSELDSPEWLPPAAYDRVVVSCTARYHGSRPSRLPDRRDFRGDIAAILVDEPDHAAEVFRLLDRPGRVIYVDVERKQALDLLAIAKAVISRSTLAHAKPNDATIRSLDVFVSHLVGADLTSMRCGVYGTGNLAFKCALLLAERNAEVHVAGRSDAAVERTVDAINAILPRHQHHPVRLWGSSSRVRLMVTAVTAQGVIGPGWLARLEQGAHVIDVGIDNLDRDFISSGLAKGLTIDRLDTRAAEGQLPVAAPGFFEEVYGRADIGGVAVVSGGIVASRGTVVVDNLRHPTRIVGIANGSGGLLSVTEISPDDGERRARVEKCISSG